MTAKDTTRYHPLCLALPQMTDDEYRALVDDMRGNPQREPIYIDAETGLILDGRGRDMACRELGKEAMTEKFHGTEEDKIKLVTSLNLKRRHLSVQQLAAVGAELAERLAEAARQRQLAGKPVAPSDTKEGGRDRREGGRRQHAFGRARQGTDAH
jgi:hypothetical protein